MPSLREPERSPVFRAIAHVLIAALVAALPTTAEASVPAAETDKLTKSAFGQLIAHDSLNPDPQPYAFAGEPLDRNVGFQNHRARWYQPDTGRFMSSDPIAGWATNPISLHKFLYGAADPVDAVDPSGEFSISEMLTSTAMMSSIFSMSPPLSLGAALAGKNKQVTVTVDDGPLGVNAQTLGVLREFGIKTTFFVVGSEAERRPESLRAILGQGHWLANHTWDHDYLPGLSYDEVRTSLRRTGDTVKRLTGWEMAPDWRAPTLAKNAEVERAASSVGYWKHHGIDIDSLDSNKDFKGNNADILRHVRSQLNTKVCNGPCQILFHDFSTSVATMRYVLSGLKNDGYTFADYR